jgi:hypothetical protein
MLKKILLGVAVALVLLCGFVASRPADFTVERATTIQAPPDLAFALVNDFHRWNEWSPWDKLDPNQKTTFEGAASGTGARYGWSGNESGEGRMSIEESTANTSVRIKLEFIRPFSATNDVTFGFKPVTQGVEVSWKMSGQRNFISKAMCLVMDMDAMIGKDFENGLAAMRQIAEDAAQKRAPEPTPTPEAIAVPTP